LGYSKIAVYDLLKQLCQIGFFILKK